MTTGKPDQLANEFKNVSNDAQDLMNAAAGSASGKLADVRASVERSLSQVKPYIDKAKTYATDTTSAAVQTTDDYVRQNPWTAIGASTGTALLLGVVIGLLIGSSSSRR